MAAAQHQGGSDPVCDEIPQDPIASVIAVQEQVFDALFVLPRSDEDWALSLDGPTHEPLSYASGWTSGAESFDLDVLHAATVDFLSSPDLTPADEQFILDTGLQMSYVSGYLRRAGEAVPIGGVVRSWIEPGSDRITHDLVIMVIVDFETIAAVEELAFQFAHDQAPCGGIPLDAEYQDCVNLVNTNGRGAFDATHTVGMVGGILGGAGTAVACVVSVGTLCPVAIAGTVGFLQCNFSSLAKISSEWQQALDCCCQSQEIRNDGRDGLSPQECEDTADWPGICG